MEEKTLSVIVPIYNVENYIEQCLDSILCQTYTDLEIFLVDDGSTDSSGEIADEYAKKDSRVRVLHKENGGLISARYAGVALSKGEYITFVDSDDWIKPEMYSVLMHIMSENRVDLVTSGCIRYFSEEKASISYDNFLEPGFYDAERIKKHVIPIMLWDERTNAWALDPSTCFKIYRKDKLMPVMDKIKNQNFYYGEDSAITYPYILDINSLYCTHEIFYYHRQRQQNIASPYITEDYFLYRLFDIYDYLYTFFENHELAYELIKQLDYFYIRSVNYRRYKYETSLRTKTSYYLFPFDKVNSNSRIIIYGAGTVGKDYKQQVEKLNFGNLVLWVDKNYISMQDGVSNPDEILNVDFDYIVIAIVKEDYVKEIIEWMLSKGISRKKIISDLEKCIC